MVSQNFHQEQYFIAISGVCRHWQNSKWLEQSLMIMNMMSIGLLGWDLVIQLTIQAKQAQANAELDSVQQCHLPMKY